MGQDKVCVHEKAAPWAVPILMAWACGAAEAARFF
jgi:hypothetical protein